MITFETDESDVEIASDADADADAAVADASPTRPTCVHTAALRYRIQQGGSAPVPAPPHVATFDLEACRQLWAEYAERVRAAVVAQRGE